MMSEAPSSEPAPKSNEIKKIKKLLEDPEEREKLIKTLRILAMAQEADEKKKEAPFMENFTPLIQFGVENSILIADHILQIPNRISALIEHLKQDDTQNDIWKALLYFPFLIFIGALIEGCLFLVFRHRLKSMNGTMNEHALLIHKCTHSYIAVFFSFLYSLLFLPLLVSEPIVADWIIGFWLVLFVVRVFLLERKTSNIISQAIEQLKSEGPPMGMPFFKVMGGIILWGIILFGLDVFLDIKSFGETFILNLILFISFPLLYWYLREWKIKDMPKHLHDSHSLETVPHTLSKPINILIKYLPWALFVITAPLAIDKILFEANMWETYGDECVETFLVFTIFLIGRRYIDDIHRYRMPQAQASKVKLISSYILPLWLPFLRTIQWILYISFFVSIFLIWDTFFSKLVISTFSSPLVKKVSSIAMIWGVIYLFWLTLDHFVWFHTTPQVIKGKRRFPTIFAKTFGPMLQSVARWVLVVVAIFFTLESLGLDLKLFVFLMSAFAFALSLGSQSLVKDIINGFFALIDGSFAVGDVVTIGSHTGTVETLSLRAITLRHGNGFLQTIPFSEVGNIINRSRDYTYVPIDIATSYKTDIGKVYEALTLAVEEMKKDSTFGKMILEPLTLSGIDRFAENAVYVSATIKIKPDPNNRFGRELNRRLKIHMDALGITPPIAFQEVWTHKDE